MEDSITLQDDFLAAACTLRFLSFRGPRGSNSVKTVSYGRWRLKNQNIWCVDGENDCMLNLKLTLSIGETIGNCFSANCSPLVAGNLKITTCGSQEKSSRRHRAVESSIPFHSRPKACEPFLYANPGCVGSPGVFITPGTYFIYY